MASEGNLKYLQYILLLGEGTKLVLQGLVDREVRKRQTTLKQILDDNKNSLRGRFRDDVQFQRIYPCDGSVNTDVNTWDIALMAKVILHLFGSTLTWGEKASVRFLKDMRNEVQAHASSMSLQNEEFQSMWSELSTTLKTLASSLKQDIQDKSDALITELSTGVGELKRLKTKIEQFAKYDEHFNSAVELIGKKLDSGLGLVAEKIEEGCSALHEVIASNKDDIENKIESTSQNTCGLIEHQAKTVMEKLDTKVDEVKYAVNQSLVQSTSGIQSGLADTSSRLQSIESGVSLMQGNFSIFGEKFDGMGMQMHELCTHLKSLLSEGKEFRKPQVVGAEVNVEGPDEELTSEAEEQLLKAFEKAKSSALNIAKRARQSNDPDVIDELEKVVKEFLERIESIEDVQADEVQKHCILLSIKCTSGAGMLALLRILIDGSIQDKLDEIAKVLISHYGGKFRLTARIVPDSVQKAIDHLSNDMEVPVIKRSMNIPVRCSTLAGLAEVCKLFSGEESVPYFENISAALSRKLGRKIIVNGSLNIGEVTKALRNVDSKEGDSIEKQASHVILEPTRQSRSDDSHAAEGFTPRHKPYKFKSHRQVNIRTNGDKKVCNIYGCCSLPDGSFLLADHSNKNVKRLNKVYEVVDWCLLPSSPWDVCYAGDSEAVVSLNNNSLQFINVDGLMTLARTVKFAHPCWGVTKSADRLYIKGGASVISYTQDGNDKHILYTDPSKESSYQHLETNDKGSKIYITGDTDAFTASVLDQEGKVLETFTDFEKKGSSDICLDGDGNVYLCGKRCKTIVQLDSETFEKVSDIITSTDEVIPPWCLCFDRDRTALIVGHIRSDTITVIDLQT